MNPENPKTPKAPSAFAIAKSETRAAVREENSAAAVLLSAVLSLETAAKNRKGTEGAAKALEKAVERVDFAPDDAAILRNAIPEIRKGAAPAKAVRAILRKRREAVRASGVERDRENLARVSTEAEAEATRKAALAAAKSAKAAAKEKLAALAAAAGVPEDEIALAIGKRKVA